MTCKSLPQSLRDILMRVQCPLLGDYSESWLNEIVFSPSPHHNQFLEWILCSFDENLSKVFEKNKFVEMKTEDQERFLLQLYSSAGICGNDNLDVIKSCGGEKEIIDFWTMLLQTHLFHVDKLNKIARGHDVNRRLDYLTSSEENISPNPLKKLVQDNQMEVTRMVRESRAQRMGQLLPLYLERQALQFAQSHNIGHPTKEELSRMTQEVNDNLQNINLDRENKDPDCDLEALQSEVLQGLQSLHQLVPHLSQTHQQLVRLLKESPEKNEDQRIGKLIVSVAGKLDSIQQILTDCEIIEKALVAASSTNSQLPETEEAQTDPKSLEMLHVFPEC